MAYNSEPQIKSFRAILLYIQRNLTKDDCHNLVFLKDLPQKDEEDCIQDIRNFWRYMLKRQNEYNYGEDDPSDLFDDLQSIGRQDIYNEAKEKYERFKQYKLSRSQGHTLPNTPGPGTQSPNQLSPESPGAGTGRGIVHHSPNLQGPGPTPSTPQPQHPPSHHPVSPPYNSPGYGQDEGSTGATAYEQPCKVPGSQYQGPMTLLNTPPPYHQVSPPYNSPGYGQDESSTGATSYEHPCKVPGSQYQGPMQLSNTPPSPKSPPTSGSLQQTPTLSPPPSCGGSGHGLKSTELLPTMPSNLVQRRRSPSNQSAPGVAHAHTGQGVSLPGSLQSKEPTHNPPRNAIYASGSAFPVQPSSAQAGSGLKSSEPLRTMPSDLVPGQGETVSVTPAHFSPVNPNSIISKASSLKSNDPTGNGLSSNINVEQFPSANSDSVISSAGTLKSSDPTGVNQPTSPQVQVPAHTSSLQAAGNTKHTIQLPIQPSSAGPDQVKDIQDLVGLSLQEAEEIALSAQSNISQQQHVLGEDDTVSDGAGAASGIGALPQDVVTDAALDLEQTGDSAIGELARALALDFHRPLKDQMKTTLRSYQKELADPGLQGVNYVICAPTGSGKTITAAHICYENMMKMKKAGREDDFKAIFIVPTRHLKKQQRDGFQDIFVPGQVTSLAEGQSFNDAFGKGNVRVLMITAQVLVNSLTQNEFKLPDTSMLVFDECHHTTLNHPYNEIMRHYLKEKKAILEGIPEEQWPVGRPCGKIPQVVGLTASVGTGTSDDAHGHIVTLCANLDSFGVKIVNLPDNEEELKVFNKLPEQDRIIPTPKRIITQTSSRFIEILETIMEEIEKNVLAKHLKEYENMEGVAPHSPTYGTQAYENWIAKIRANAELRFPNLEICANYLFRLNLALLLYEDLRALDALESIEVFKQQTKGIQDDLPDGRHCRMIYEKDLQELKDLASIENPFSNPKLLCLHELIKKVYKKEPESKGIVLARTRFATYALQNFIKSCDELKEEPRIRPVRIVGQSKEIDQGQTEARQEGALNDFKSKDRANLLVATDIVQEGLDIPACNLIIRYNFVSNEIGTVQSKGRARKEGSKCFLIVERGSVNEARENKNRERVVEMDRAIKEANALPREAWHQEIRQRQLTIIDEIVAKDEQKRIQQEESKQVNVKLMCNKCEKFICKSSDLERRLANYTCLDPTIGERTRIVGTGRIEFRESRTIGIVKCRCGNQLGQALEFKRLHVWKPGYNFSPKSFLFIYNDDPASERRFAKWKKVDFPIATEE